MAQCIADRTRSDKEQHFHEVESQIPYLEAWIVGNVGLSPPNDIAVPEVLNDDPTSDDENSMDETDTGL